MKETEIIKKALNALEKQTGLELQFVKNLRDKDKNYETVIKIRDGKKQELRYLLDVKRIINNAVLGQALLEAKSGNEKIILVAEHISPRQAEKLRSLEMAFVDTAGNAYLNAQGLFVFVTGNKGQITKERPIDIFNANGIKLLFHLLNDSNLINEDYRTIENITNVSKSTIGRIFKDLEKTGFLIRRADGIRYLQRKPELLRRWVENYPERLRIKLSPVRYRSKKFTGRWWEEIDIKDYKAVWGGETGGASLTDHLRPGAATIYADSTLPKLQAKYKLVRDDKGEIEILRKFWTSGEAENLAAAPPLVVYADLLATADERNLETAAIIYDKYLAQITKETS